RPPADLTVAEGVADAVDAHVVGTVGTDCSTGKMTTSYALRDAARDRGVDAAVVPTGQTGILIDGGGIAVDRVISDFAAGAVERMVRERGDHDLLVVEGQGALGHPAYSGVTLSILHGAQPDGLVLCHEAGRDRVHSYESFAIPPVAEYADLYERLSAPVRDTDVVAGCLNTRSIGADDAAADAVEDYADRLGVPAPDPVRFDADAVLDAVLPD
ncbi:MAG: NAD-dependent epimerase/dehydratase family protein, partial [Haloplanus sp.]